MLLSDLKNKRVAVVGMLRSGYKITNFLMGKTASLTAVADLTEKEKISLGQLTPLNQIQWVEGPAAESALLDQDLIITSVGHRSFADALQSARAKNIPVVSELDFVLPFLTGRIVGISGTNGKSTTLSFLQDFLQAAGMAFSTGGMGDLAFIETLIKPAPITLFEISSTHLRESELFHPHIAVLTSLSPAHMERHRSNLDYFLTKAKLYSAQDPNDYFVYHANSEPLKKLMKRVPPRSHLIPFHYLEEIREGIFRQGGDLIWRYRGKSETYSLSGFSLPGAQNVENLMAAVATAKLLEVPKETIQNRIPRLEALPYRLQEVASIGGVRYFNDAKATNLTATAWGLHALKNNTLLIMGGDFGPGQEDTLFRESLTRHVKTLLVFGSRRRDFLNVWEGATEIFLVQTLAEAVQLAHQKAVKGDQVLFSPGTHPELHVHGGAGPRGEEFNRAVLEIKNREKLRHPHQGITRI